MWPFIAPNHFCLAAKYFCEWPIIKNIKINPITDARIAVIAITTLVYTIITIEPTNMVTAETSVVILLCIVVPIVSTSFVTLDNTSPVVVLWK